MITLSNINCSNINITSESITDLVANPSEYTNVKIEGKLNCCDEVYTEELTSENINDFSWELQFPTESTLELSELIFQNYITKEEFQILPAGSYPVSSYACSSGDITNLFPIIQQWFTDNFGVTVTQGYTYDPVTNTCVYTITDLPDSIVPLKLVTSRDDVKEDIFFNYSSLSNVFISGSNFVINPEFFGFSESFVNGIYDFTLTFTTNEGDIIIEHNCFFFDCNIACQISKKVEELLSCEKSGTNLFLLHYTLVEGSNCGCNCSELCEIFTALCNKLSNDKTCTSCGC